jgi:hypothetical protein
MSRDTNNIVLIKVVGIIRAGEDKQLLRRKLA